MCMVTILPRDDVEALIEELSMMQEKLPEQARVLRLLLDQISRHEKMAAKKNDVGQQQYQRAKDRLQNLIQQLQGMSVRLGKHTDTIHFLEARSR